jgi:hypothetical protein
MTRLAALPLLMLVTCACATPRATLRELPEADITTAAQVRPHLQRSDTLLWWFIILAAANDFEDPQCPVRVELGNTTIWTGGCIDKNGHTWSGSQRIRTGRQGLSVRFREFPLDPPEATIHGHARINRRGLSIALRYDDEDTGRNVIIFEGRQAGLPLPGKRQEKAQTVVSGTGFFASEKYGKVEFETHEIRDGSVCKTEPVSGSTRLFSGGHTVEVIYDGAVDCDPEGLATWTLDGVPMGELKIPQCSATDDERRWPWLLVIMVVAARRRRISPAH